MNKQSFYFYRERIAIISSVIIVIIADIFLYSRFIGLKNQIVSGWNPLRGEATFSMKAFIFMFVNLILFILIYLGIKSILKKIK